MRKGKKKVKRKPEKRKARKAKKAKRGGKSTGVQTLIRQDAVFKLLLAGHPRRYIVKHSKKKWAIGPDQVDKYIRKATDVWIEASRFDRESELSKEIERTDGLYRIALKRKNYLTALSALKHLCVLKKLNNMEIDLKGAITLENRIEGMTDEEINKIETEICTRLTQAGINLKRKSEKKASKKRGE